MPHDGERNPGNKFSQRDRKTTTITPYSFAKYMIYGWTGGFYCSREFKAWMKYSWILINIVACITILLVGCFGYWITTENKTFADKAFALAIANTNFFAIIVMPVMTYYFRKELEIILHFVEKKWSPQEFDEIEIRQNAQGHLFYALLSGSFVATVYTLMHPALMLLYGSTKLHSLQHYLYPVPWITQIDSLTIYFLISFVHCSCAAFTISVLVALPPFLMIIAFEFYFAFAILGNSLEKLSDQLHSTLDESFSEDSSQNRVGTTFQKEIEKYQLRLLEKVMISARDHQQILKKIKLIKPFIEILFSLFLPCFVVASCFLIYMYLSETLTLLQKIKTMGIVGGWTIMMFAFTHAGRLFEEMEENFSNVVYGFPWYYLNPKQRKVYYIFLNQTKHPVRFHALTMYSMVPMTSLNCIKLLYSFGNLLRNQINRRQVK